MQPTQRRNPKESLFSLAKGLGKGPPIKGRKLLDNTTTVGKHQGKNNGPAPYPVSKRGAYPSNPCPAVMKCLVPFHQDGVSRGLVGTLNPHSRPAIMRLALTQCVKGGCDGEPELPPLPPRSTTGLKQNIYVDNIYVDQSLIRPKNALIAN